MSASDAEFFVLCSKETVDASMRPRHVCLGCIENGPHLVDGSHGFNEAEACLPRMLLRYNPLNIQATLPRFRPPLIRDKQSVPNSPHNPINDIK